MSNEAIIQHTRNWLEQIVIGLNLCPFAAKPFKLGQIRIVVSTAKDIEALSADLIAEGALLLRQPAKETETTLLVHPFVLADFYDYNEYLWSVEEIVRKEDWEGEIQVASFHPEYQFAGTTPEDVSNYTNRSPYPMLHLIREERLEAALEHYEDPEGIPERNVALLERIGLAEMLNKLNAIKPK